MRKFKPSKAQARAFAQQMNEIDDFCRENAISRSKSSDSYYFNIYGQNYRVSNHTIAASNRGAYGEFGEQIREKYHEDRERDDVIYITAGKTRIIDIYTDLSNGYKLDRRGNRI